MGDIDNKTSTVFPLNHNACICCSRFRPGPTRRRRRCPPSPRRPTRIAFHLKVTFWAIRSSHSRVLRVVITTTTTGREAFNLLTTFTYCLIFQSTASSYRRSPTNCWVSCYREKVTQRKGEGRETFQDREAVCVVSSEPNPKRLKSWPRFLASLLST